MAQAEARHYINAAHDTELRRKKTTMERAKANYLCSQLRIRLQYAKLKVDHGWQKQTLNEVENLYFRHSHTNRQHFNTVNVESADSQQSTASSQINGGSSTTQSLTSGTSADNVNNNPAGEEPQSRLAISHSQTLGNQMSPVAMEITTPRQPGRRTPSAKGKERDHSLPTPLFNAVQSASTQPLSPPKRTNRAARHAPIIEDFPPATLADGGLQSSAKYLSSTYISSSPFPINVPIPSQEIPTSPFGKRDQALTYDSFWSSHSTWSSNLSIAGTGSPTRSATTTYAATTTSASS
ncbi:hypothetical protein BDY19DRAFT_993761 [Irpex rosettiformis]|uniref:Uncharacterized protein n=1 Tax=Irpex rosettiformis TaxID=378272 RepID=A0ACB8U3J0_9APHY|nr:hypothetical protein BDY19DRAFT_993761 [Irpex rosettiformis]